MRVVRDGGRVGVRGVGGGLVKPEGGGDALGGGACEAPLLGREDEIFDVAVFVSDAMAAAVEHGLDAARVVEAVQRPPDLDLVADLNVVEQVRVDGALAVRHCLARRAARHSGNEFGRRLGLRDGGGRRGHGGGRW